MAKRNLKSILVRMPTTLKRRLAREVARRESTLNDVAVEILADRVRRRLPAERPARPGARRRRGRPPAHAPRAQAAARRGRARAPQQHEQRRRRDAHRAARRSTPRKETMARNGSQNGKARSKDKVRVAIIGVGNCANSLLQGVEYYKDASPDEFVPGLMHVDLGGYHVRDIEFTAAFDVTTAKVGKDLADAIWARAERHDQVRRRPEDRHHRLARHDARRARQVPLRDRREGARRHRRRRRDPPGDRHGRRRQLPPGRLRGGDEVVHRADPERGLRDGELHAGLHRQGRLLRAPASRSAGCRSSATTSSRRSARRSRTAC